MIIICGHVLVDAAQRETYLEAHRDLVRRAREAEGCISLSISPDLLDARRINNTEVWRDAEALGAWRARADAPALDVPFLDVAIQRYDATDGGPVF